MELLVTLRKLEALEYVLPYADGIITGRNFTTAYHLSLDEIEQAVSFCKKFNKKSFIVMDDFVSEDEKMQMYDYLDFIDGLDVDGIFFHDLGVYSAAKSYGLVSKLIYDGKSVMCNSLDSAFLLDKGIDSVMISRELTLDEVKEILANHPGRIDMQVFGHLRMSYSGRHFLKNYFREIGKDYDYLGKETLSLVEEQRDYKMPIVEDEDGTYIYTDYIFEMFDELPELRESLRYGVVDTLFIEDLALVCQILRDYRRINASNSLFIRNSFLHNHPGNFTSGYFYQKTNLTKDE